MFASILMLNIHFLLAFLGLNYVFCVYTEAMAQHHTVTLNKTTPHLQLLPVSKVDQTYNIYHEGNISKMPDFDVFSVLECKKRKSRSHGKRKNGNIKRKICTEKRLNTSLKDLSLALTNHGRHGLFSFLSSLPISVLRNLELEANKLYDRANKLYKAALLTRCYVQHFLSPYIDSEVNHKRHFIKIPFINKGIEFIDLHSIFKDNSVISSIPNYFNNSETPIICYKYNKPIRSTIFNFNKIVNDLDIDSNTPAS